MRSTLAICATGLLLLSFGTACGSSTAAGGVHPTSPFTDADAKLFEDGVDFVSDPAALGGRWAEEAEREAIGRIDAADAITVVTVTALRTDIDPQQRTTYGIATTTVENIKGTLGGDPITLSVSGDAPGYATIDRDRQRLLNERLVAFVKWYAKHDGTVGTHFHLSIASPVVLQQVRQRLDRNKPSKSIIIEKNVQE